MRHRFLALSLLLACAPAFSTAPGWAQTAEDATTAMARARFKEGVEFFDKGDFEQARASFLQAYALKRHPAVLLNLAWSCLKAGHPLEAEKYFEQFPADSKEVTDKQRADAADGLAQSRAKLGRIQVIAASGAEVTLDGERAGVAPLAEAIYVEPGAHTVRTKGADGTIDVESVTVLAGEERVARGSKAAAPVATPPAAAVAPTPPPTPPPPAPAPAPPPVPAAPPGPPPAPESTKSEVQPPPRAETPAPPAPGKSFFPANMVPVYVGGAITIVSAGVAIALGAFKQDALSNANATAGNIRAQGRTCPAPAGSEAALINACSVLASDNDNVNADATGANVAVGVAVAGLVGTVVYWVLADKAGTSPSSGRATIAPILGPSVGGLAVMGEF
ncbi:MAG TPA: tetratricopeptide repeat protein [Polyangiaceae bacterium]|jgi:hypothetical protein|nr:tetratricopeptide repeat protein [Polyangiaceae bacterium]